jgi:hypothetical protein
MTVLDEHKRFAGIRTEDGRYLRNVAAAPFIYGLLGPLAILDGAVSLYQAVCFRLWGIQRVHRSEYLIIDRHKLAYLDGLQKLNCV